MTENILGRKIEDIDAADLVEYFTTGRKESDLLEFKSIVGPLDKQKVMRTICAFLNSSGGVIVWGAPVEVTENKEKVVKGALTPTTEHLKKDSFITSLSDKTVPVPANVRFQPVEVEPGKFVYVIEVLASNTKPHQYDHRYWMRLDGQTREAPHHYIEALFRQVKYPNLEGYLRIHDIQIEYKPFNDFRGREPLDTYYQLKVEFMIFNLSPFQNEEGVSLFAFSNLGNINEYRNDFQEIVRQREVNFTASKDVLHYGAASVSKVLIVAFWGKEISATNNIIKLVFAFGGKFSPQKVSSYTLDLSKYDEDDFFKIVVEKTQNKTNFDLRTEAGITNEEYLRRAIGPDYIK
ncbi:MAG: ATP-binding protein [Haliscomenobacteraceae bacterium CHB4]|nr:hypothetical protein [Saprospiraceae bacterium]MCE7924665.1 ATP-binding protein [Haliscomenobacteraceae bacterium CHB4]